MNNKSSLFLGIIGPALFFCWASAFGMQWAGPQHKGYLLIFLCLILGLLIRQKAPLTKKTERFCFGLALFPLVFADSIYGFLKAQSLYYEPIFYAIAMATGFFMPKIWGKSVKALLCSSTVLLLVGLLTPAFSIPYISSAVLIFVACAYGIFGHNLSTFFPKNRKVNYPFVLLIIISSLYCHWNINKKPFKDQPLFGELITQQIQGTLGKYTFTQFKNTQWTYKNQQLIQCNVDQAMYHEPFVLYPMQYLHKPKRLLIIGDLNGSIRQIAKRSNSWAQIDYLPLDYDGAKAIQGKDKDSSTHWIQQSLGMFLNNDQHDPYDLILMDLPEALTIQFGRWYSQKSFQLVKNQLSETGIMVCNATNPFLFANSFKIIKNTIASTGMHTKAFHNSAPSLGDRAWIMASKADFEQQDALDFDRLQTKWLTQESISLITHFPKGPKSNDQQINTLQNNILASTFNSEILGSI